MYSSILQPLAVMALLDTVASAVTHRISVGARGALKFDPADLTAAVGDTLEFRFYNPSGPHNVVSGDFSSPCTPKANAFFSGDIEGDSNGNEAFLIKVTSTEPIYFYCSKARHCQNGMAGAVNAPAGQGSTAYIQGARRVPQADEPSVVTGGTVTSLSGAGGGGTATTATSSASSPPSSLSSSSVASSAAVSTSSTENSSMSSANLVSTLTSTVASSGSSSGSATGAGAVVTLTSGTVRANTGTATTSPSATTTPNVGAGRQSQGIVLGVLAAVLGGFVALMA